MSTYHDDETFWMFEYKELKTDYEQLKEENEKLIERLRACQDAISAIKHNINVIANI